MSDDEKKPAAAMKPHDPSIGKVWTTRDEISEMYCGLDDYEQFELTDKNVSLDPHEEGGFSYSCFRSKDGGRLSKDILDNDFILVGNDKAGLSGVLAVPVPPGGTLSVRMSTWVNPCHSGYEVSPSYCFGVGMVPFGEGKEQNWRYEDTKTCIENGVQFLAELNLGNLLSRGFGRGGYGLEYSFDVMEDGSRRRRDARTKLSLQDIHVRIRREQTGVSELSFVQDDTREKITCRSETEKGMQLYFNCLGWADNNTYVQIHKVEYSPPEAESKKDVDEPEEAHSKKKQSSAAIQEQQEEAKPNNKRARPVDREEEYPDEYPDYGKILKEDPELRKEVDDLIAAKKK